MDNNKAPTESVSHVIGKKVKPIIGRIVLPAVIVWIGAMREWSTLLGGIVLGFSSFCCLINAVFFAMTAILQLLLVLEPDMDTATSDTGKPYKEMLKEACDLLWIETPIAVALLYVAIVSGWTAAEWSTFIGCLAVTDIAFTIMVYAFRPREG